jgi:tripartite-type tricarboxylate transporter receptor subunit TctC
MAITRRVALAGAATLLTALGCRTQAQDYPNRLIRLFTGFPPGGNADVVARILAGQLEKELGQTVIVEAKPGAGGSLAAETVARSAPDGYTLLAVPNVHPIYGALSTHVRYKVVDDFTWISTATFFPYVICVRADSRIETLVQLIEAAHARPGALNYGGGQIGTGMHMVVELIANRTASKFVRIPYRGESDAIAALLSGEVDFIAATTGPIAAHIRAGAVRPLAITSKTRWPGLTDVPTVDEAGVPGFEVMAWMGLAGPADLPAPIVARLNAEMRKAVADPNVKSRLEAMGGELRAIAPNEMKALVARQYEVWKKLATDVHLTID